MSALSFYFIKLIKSAIKLAAMLPSKTIPEVKNRKHHALKPRPVKSTSTTAAPPRKKVRVASATEVEGEDGPHGGHNSARCTVPFHASFPAKVSFVWSLHSALLTMILDLEKHEEKPHLSILRSRR
jgi:hypothetical protein